MAQMQAEHETEGAREQLASGWKAWLAERGQQPAAPQGAGGAVVSTEGPEILED